MNTWQHLIQTSKTDGIGVAIVSLLPDIFIPLRRIAPEPLRQWCWEMHNTQRAIDWVRPFGMARAWRKHWELDQESHEYSYTMADRIPKDSILLLSGGLDSFVAWRMLGQPRAVYFALGHRYQRKEVDRITAIRETFGGDISIDHRLHLGDQEMENAYIPYRNLLLITLASNYSSNVVIPQICEWAPDKNTGFYHALEQLLGQAGRGHYQNLSRRVRVWSPFVTWTKTRMVAMYARQWDIRHLTQFTTSCYHPTEEFCGQCTGCRSRFIAMSNNGIQEPYMEKPNLSQLTISWKDFRLGQVGMYIRRYLELRNARRLLAGTLGDRPPT